MASYKGLKTILKKFADLIEPPASMKLYAGNEEPEWHFFCLGQLKLIADYPKLYRNLGGADSPWNTGTVPDGYFRLPDMREYVAVGAGLPGDEKNTTSIFDNTELDPATETAGTQTHDAYSVGELKDDQIEYGQFLSVTRGQGASGSVSQGGTEEIGSPTGSSGLTLNQTWYRIGKTGATTTHGKQVGLFYIIKY